MFVGCLVVVLGCGHCGGVECVACKWVVYNIFSTYPKIVGEQRACLWHACSLESFYRSRIHIGSLALNHDESWKKCNSRNQFEVSWADMKERSQIWWEKLSIPYVLGWIKMGVCCLNSIHLSLSSNVLLLCLYYVYIWPIELNWGNKVRTLAGT